MSLRSAVSRNESIAYRKNVDLPDAILLNRALGVCGVSRGGVRGSVSSAVVDVGGALRRFGFAGLLCMMTAPFGWRELSKRGK